MAVAPEEVSSVGGSVVGLRNYLLRDTGDLGAPPGSRPWATAMHLQLQGALKEVSVSSAYLTDLVRGFVQHKGYQQLTGPDGNGFLTYEAYCSAPEPHGLGYDKRDIDRIIAERRSAEAKAKKAKAIPKHGEVGRGRNRGSERTSNGRGETSDYLTARIARDRPDILERMKAGEFKSVRAAAKEAGIVTRRVSIPDDPKRAAALILKHFGEEWLREFEAECSLLHTT